MLNKIKSLITKEKVDKFASLDFEFSYLMDKLNCANTFEIIKHTEIENGVDTLVKVASGSTPQDLINHKEAIENALKSLVIFEEIRFSNTVRMKVITKDLKKYDFSPVKALDHQLYLGKTMYFKDVFLDITKASHILIGGATGTGKTFLLALILTNLIYNSSDYIDIHLSQIMKGEVGLFKECKPVKFIGYNLSEVAYDLQRVAKIVNNRSKQFTDFGVKNLSHYNKNFKKRMKRIYYVLEEISFFMPRDTDSEETKTLKGICWDAILTIVKAGRSSGVHLISVTQRSTVTNLPSDVKSQLCRISLRQISSIDSRNIIECDDACKLKDGECLVYGSGDTMEIIKIPYVDEDFNILNSFVKEIRIPQISQEVKDETVWSSTPVQKLVANIRPKDKPNLEPKVESKTIKEPKKRKRVGVINCDN